MTDKIKGAFGGWLDILMKLLVTTMVTAIFIRTYEVPEIRVKIEALENKIDEREAIHKDIHQKYENEFDKIKQLLYPPHESFRKKDQSFMVPDSLILNMEPPIGIVPRENQFLTQHN
jgi:hypothetical protein